MWVEELKNGKYKFVERYTDPMTGKSKRVAVVMDKNTARNRKMAALTLSGKIESASRTASGQDPFKRPCRAVQKRTSQDT